MPDNMGVLSGVGDVPAPIQMATPTPPPLPDAKPPGRSFMDPRATRDKIYNNVQRAAQTMPPWENSRHRLELSKIEYQGPENYTMAEQKKAILQGDTLSRKLRGTMKLYNKTTGDLLDERRTTLAHVPYMTDRGTFIMGGNEMVLGHQMRLRSGIFTIRKEDGDIENHVNVLPGKGVSHAHHLDPSTGELSLSVRKSHMPMITLMRAMGATDKELREAWGNDILAANQKFDRPKALDKVLSKFVRKADPGAPTETKHQLIKKAMEAMELDPEVTKRTLGGDFKNLTKETLLASTAKLIKVNRKEADTDDRDSAPYQRILGPEDLLSERLHKDKKSLNDLLWKISGKGNLQGVMPGLLNKTILAPMSGNSLAMNVEEINMSELLDQQTRVTRMGEGGIKDIDNIPDSSRNVIPSQFPFIDSLRTPESAAAGVDARFAYAAHKGDDGRVYAPYKDARTGKTSYKSPQDVADLTVAFPNEMRDPNAKHVVAVHGGKIKYVPREQVDLEVGEMEHGFSPLANMVPMKSAVKGQRVAMGSRMLTQALPLHNAEAPLVQSAMPDDPNKSFEVHYGTHMGAIRAKMAGRVLAVTPDGIKVKYEDGHEEVHDMANNFPHSRKTFNHNTPMVGAGDRFAAGHLLAKSNYTDNNGTTALGTNPRVAFLAHQGNNYEDAISVREGWAKDLKSEHMYQHTLDYDDNVKMGKTSYMSLFPGRLDKKTLENFDDKGLIKPGTIVKDGDPLVLATKKKEFSHGQIHKQRGSVWSDATVNWDHHHDGIVTDVAETKDGVNVTVKSYIPTGVGDKLANRYGGKGLISNLIPDHLMPYDESGKPFDVLLNPLGVVSRSNPAQLVETSLGKIAAQTGKPYKVQDFKHINDLTEYALDELKKHGMSDTETVIDPATGRKIENVMTGNQFFMKLHHMAESKVSGRGVGAGYSAEGIPSKGGEEGSKRLAMGDTYALLNHGSVNVLQDAHAIRGTKNEDYWSAFQSGQKPPPPKVPIMYQKFIESLRGSGINVVREGHKIHIMAMTKNDVAQLSGGRNLKNTETVDYKDNQKAIKGGLFDTSIFGESGEKWGQLPLHEPLPNPAMQAPIMHLLGMTEKTFMNVLSGKEEFNGKSGPKAIQNAMEAINLDKEIDKARAEMAATKGDARNKAIRKLGYLKSAKSSGIHPKDWFLDAVPILPPKFRPMSTVATSGSEQVDDANYLIKEVHDANEALKATEGVIGEKDRWLERETVYKAFKGLVGLGDPVQPKHVQKGIKGILGHVLGEKAKLSSIQYKLLGTNVDLVGRAAITPDPDLDMDSVALPEEKAWEVYKPFIVRRLVKQGMKPFDAARLVKDKGASAKNALLKEMNERPVIVNRAPVLHRYSVMAYRPKLTSGDVMKLSPICTKGHGADFDGDQQFSHVFCRISVEVRRGLVYNEGVSDTFLEACLMSARFKTSLPAVTDGALYVFHLEEFPHGKQIKTTEGQFGPIDWYEVPKGVQVLAMGPDGHMQWTDVSVWSVHHNCPVQVVDLQSGRQIFTDDDPRAVFGVSSGSLKLSRATPKEAVAKGYMVPRAVSVAPVPDPINEITITTNTAAKHGNHMCDALTLDADLGYVIGVAAGDGWSTEVGKQFVVAGVSRELIAKLDEIIPRLFDGAAPNRCSIESKHSYGESWRHTWGSVDLNAFIADCVGRKATCKRLPLWFLRAPEAFRQGLMAGLMDTDGSVSVSHGKKAPQLIANYSSISLRLCQEMLLLAGSLGIRGRITPSKTPAGKPYWLLSFSNYDFKKRGGKYMVHVGKLEKLASVEIEVTPNLSRHDLVPVSNSLADYLCRLMPTPKDKKKWPKGQDGVYSAFTVVKKKGYVSRDSAKRLLKFIDVAKAAEHPDWVTWQAIVADETVTWDKVVSFQDTGNKVTGYDLTVPGCETFTDINGIVLSNTMQFHVPATDEARDEALTKMLPSSNLFSAASMKAHYLPQQEYVGGMYSASTAKNDKRPRVFRNKQDAIKAYKAGELHAGDPIEIVDHQ